MKQITLKKIEEELDFFKAMYDVVRIVDPIHKRVLEYKDCMVKKTDSICYNYWKNGKICDNCVSARAYCEENSFMKLDYKPEMIMMVTAIPVVSEGDTVILELLKNVTDSIMVGSCGSNDERLLRNVVSEFDDMVIKDKLTQLYNRRFIDDRLPAEIVSATLEGESLSVIFLDVDGLKEINDTYGHAVGDLAIQEVGNAIQNNIRIHEDWAARYGGDEFLICLNNTTYDDAYHVAERIRENVERAFTCVDDKVIRFTISLGIHSVHKSHLTAKDIISMADRKMYEAKKSGKNHSC